MCQCVSFRTPCNLLVVVQSSIDNLPVIPNRYSRGDTELKSPNDPRMGEIRRNSASEEKQQAILFRQRPETVTLHSKVEGGRIE